MDTKKMIEKLVTIADNQQKIINKLAQQLPPPNSLKPVPTQKNAGKVLYDALPLNVQKTLAQCFARGGTMYIRFKEGQQSQAAANIIQATLQKLTDENKVQQAYTFEVLG
jgi:hypothetical protein